MAVPFRANQRGQETTTAYAVGTQVRPGLWNLGAPGGCGAGGNVSLGKVPRARPDPAGV